MPPVRIMVNAAAVTDEPCGIKRYLQKLVPSLARFCSVTVLTSEPAAFSPLDCRIAAVPRWTRGYYHRFLWQATLLARYCTTDHDVLFNPTPLGTPLVRLPIISCVHDLTPLKVNRLHSTLYKATFWADLRSLRWSDAIAVDSQHTAQDLSRHRIVPAGKMGVVPLAPAVLPAKQASPFGREFRPFILYVGGHWAHKNVGRLLAAFARLSRPPGVKLVMVGGGQIELTRRAIDQFGTADSVLLLQDISDNDLSSLYANCEVFVCPSLYEGFGLPVLEALAHGAPVAASSSSSLPEVAGQAALFFNPHSVSEIAGQIQVLLDNRALADGLRSAGPIQAARFSWEQTARDIHSIALRLMKQPGN